MIPKTIEFEGNEYRRGKTIKGNRTTYVEYKNIEIGKIKFFEKRVALFHAFVYNNKAIEIATQISRGRAAGSSSGS